MSFDKKFDLCLGCGERLKEYVFCDDCNDDKDIQTYFRNCNNVNRCTQPNHYRRHKMKWFIETGHACTDCQSFEEQFKSKRIEYHTCWQSYNCDCGC